VCALFIVLGAVETVKGSIGMADTVHNLCIIVPGPCYLYSYLHISWLYDWSYSLCWSCDCQLLRKQRNCTSHCGSKKMVKDIYKYLFKVTSYKEEDMNITSFFCS
jgi:hypothetical protein